MTRQEFEAHTKDLKMMTELNETWGKLEALLEQAIDSMPEDAANFIIHDFPREQVSECLMNVEAQINPFDEE